MKSRSLMLIVLAVALQLTVLTMLQQSKKRQIARTIHSYQSMNKVLEQAISQYKRVDFETASVTDQPSYPELDGYYRRMLRANNEWIDRNRKTMNGYRILFLTSPSDKGLSPPEYR